MLTLDALKELGADTEDGLKRCMGNEDFYLKLVEMALKDDSYERLRTSIENGNLDEAFERAHALKGVLGNVSLVSPAAPVIEITEDLRARKEMDYTPYLERIFTELGKLRALLDQG